MKIAGNPKKKWLLSFKIDKSVIHEIIHSNRTTWFNEMNKKLSTVNKNINYGIVFDQETIKKRKRATTYSDCDTILLGYADLQLPIKQEGTL